MTASDWTALCSRIDDELYFASEAKALLTVLAQARAFNAEALAHFVAFG
jgi:hypothetical protein